VPIGRAATTGTETMTELKNFDKTPEASDIAHHFHGYTDARRHQDVGPMIIESGQGIYVTDNSGKRYIEGLSGLWSVGVGFQEDRLINAATKQLKQLPYYHNFGHKSHQAAIALSDQLVELAHVPMSKVFYTNSGSEANDTVLKMVWYRSNALGKPEKKKVIARTRGYHGVTIASASLTGLPNNHRSFDLPIDPLRQRSGSTDPEGRSRYRRRLLGRAGHGCGRRRRSAENLLREDPGRSCKI
jgi:4-aminobutyrate--pyruvate transaminase